MCSWPSQGGRHTPSIAFWHLPPKEGCRKAVLGVCVDTEPVQAYGVCSPVPTGRDRTVAGKGPVSRYLAAKVNEGVSLSGISVQRRIVSRARKLVLVFCVLVIGLRFKLTNTDALARTRTHAYTHTRTHTHTHTQMHPRPRK